MKISDEIMRMIGESKISVAQITENSNLYTDLGYDSLAFVCLLLKIEEAYSIQFGILEMEICLWVDRLIALVEWKVKESANDWKRADEIEA